MQRIHLIGPREIEELSGSTAHAVLPEFLPKKAYKDFFSARAARGEEVIYINEARRLSKKDIESGLKDIGVSHVVLRVREGQKGKETILNDIYKLQFNNFKVTLVLRPLEFYNDYRFFMRHTDKSVNIGLPTMTTPQGNGWGRFCAVSKLIMDQSWDLKRKYYLWKLENPAELAAYSRAFIFRIGETFAGFISGRCFTDSMMGVAYSPSLGLLYSPIEDNGLLGVSYSYRPQYTQFVLNDESMKGFASGKLGDGLWNEYKAWTAEGYDK